MNRFSKVTVFIIIFILIGIRLTYSKWESPAIVNVLTWDAFGYYLYLPGQFIYHDIRKMNWVDSIQEKYHPTGSLYQLSKLPNGNKALKYLGGIAILYSPFFFIGHFIAGWAGYPQDGFSTLYQLSICFAALFYAFLALWVLRWVLLKYFSDPVTALTLLLIGLATNYAQYVSVDSAMTHGFIFTLYAVLLAVTILWHEHPTHLKAFAIGCIIGLGVISRPTEGVMIFIPLFYSTQNIISKKAKWDLVRQYRSHLITLFIGGLLSISPQLIYWKAVSGKWIYDVGSKWTFLNPHWRVLFGWEKGWFIYTPVAIVMVLGMFFFRKNSFYRSVIIFFTINVWIIMAWSDWRYGASFSCRALVQSYAVMALPMAAIVQKIYLDKWRPLIWSVSVFLILLNLFQTWQYNKGILHFNDMNRRYYQAIFLNPHPTPLQMSLMDTKDYLKNEKSYSLLKQIEADSQFKLNVVTNAKTIFYTTNLSQIPDWNPNNESWIHISIQVLSAWGAFDTNLSSRLDYGNTFKETDCRMQNGICENMKWNTIEYYFKVPSKLHDGIFSLSAETKSNQDIFIKNIALKFLQKMN